MRFPPSLLDDIRARLPVSQVVARKVALRRAGRELKGLSPFKQEKTPSFFVNDHKGSWFDFSSGQNGDIFKFVMLTEGLSFPEAVERLAEEAGLPIPKASPREVEQEDERARLHGVVEAAARFFEEQLARGPGAEARRYLDRRGLTATAIARFRLGYAPNDRSALREHLAKAGFTTAEMTASGMLVSGEDIPVAYDRFRHRVMFPITDLRGRVIAFGGRALDPDAPAKYLNSPETPLFHKGAILYNAHNARGPAHDKGQLIAVEGYMDAIALAEAGFPQTVAPLGTALTEDQVKLLWRLAPEPILCFDGDAAGRRAAFRAVETVLPHLKPGHSVQFALLPDGLDPDDLIRYQGAKSFQSVLGKARPLVDVLWDKELSGRSADTPERRASFFHRLEQLVLLIRDPKVQAQYRREFKDRQWRFWRERGGQGPRSSSHGKLSLSQTSRDETLLLAVIAHPWLLDEFTDAIVGFEFESDVHSRVFSYILQLHSDGSDEIEAGLQQSHFAPLLEGLSRHSGHKGITFVRRSAEPDVVRKQFSTFIETARLSSIEEEMERLKELLEVEPTEELLHQLQMLRDEVSKINARKAAVETEEVPQRDLSHFLKDFAAGKYTKPH